MQVSAAAGILSAGVVTADTSSGPLSPSELLADRLRSAPKVVAGASGRFRVSGAQTLQVMDLSSWAERVATEVQRMAHISLPPVAQHRVQIDVLPSSTNRAAGVHRSQAFSEGALAQRLVIVGYEETDYVATERALCRLLLDACVVHKQDAADRAGQLRGVPGWMAIGTAQSLHPGRRERDGAEALAMWERGELGSLPQALRVVGGESPSAALCGFLVRWLTDLPGEPSCFASIFERLAAGDGIDAAWLATCVPGCESVSDLDALWDARLLRERRVVYVLHRPGATSRALLDRLRSRLLIRRGDCGIRLDDKPGRALTFRGLIGQRGAEWIPAFVEGKCGRLRLMAVGREKRFGELVEAYCAFLEALQAGKSRDVLEGLLGEAERRFADLEAGIPGGE